MKMLNGRSNPKSRRPNSSGFVTQNKNIRLRVVSNSKGQTELDLCRCNLTHVPPEVFQFMGIEVLKLTDNEIDCLPTMISYLRSLKKLLLSKNLLTSLPETIVNCKHLTELDLTHNRFPSLPRSVGALRQLRFLKVGKNDIEQIPHDIGQLTSLRHLDMHQNKLWYLPFSIQNLRKLLYLNLSNNLFDQVPMPVCRLSTLHSLNLSQNRLVNLPPGFENLNNLRELNMGENKFTSLNSTIIRLRHLKYLNLGNNRLSFVPQELTKLQCLRVLHLQGNLLETVPERFDNLQYLNVSKNKIHSFSVGRMKNLVCLNAANNELEVLPRGLFDLAHLKFLRLENNNIHDIPEEIGQLKKLQNLDVSNNNITSLPMSVYKLENLQSFNIKGNNIINKHTSPQPMLEQKTFGLFRKNKNGISTLTKTTSVRPSRNSTLRSVKSVLRSMQGQERSSKHHSNSSSPNVIRHSNSNSPKKRHTNSNTDKHANMNSPNIDRHGNITSPDIGRHGKRRSLSEIQFQTKEIAAEFSSENSSPAGSLRSYKSDPHLHRLVQDDAAAAAVAEGKSMQRITDYNLLGVCSQLESMLSKELLHPVLTLNGSIKKRFRARTIKKTSDGIWRLSPDNTVKSGIGSFGIEYSQPETFTITDKGGSFVSSFNSNIHVSVPPNCVSMVAHATLQIMNVQAVVLAKLREVNWDVENLVSVGPIIFLRLLESQLSFNTSVTITIPSPTETKRGHLTLISITEDNSCVPCSSGFKVSKNAVTFNAWNFTGKVAVITKAKCKYKACKSMEQLLLALGVMFTQA